MRVTYMISLNHDVPAQSITKLHAYKFAANPRNPAQTRTFPRNATRKFGLAFPGVRSLGEAAENSAFCHVIAGFLQPLDGQRGKVVGRKRRLALRAFVHNPRDRRRRSVSHPLNEARTLPQSLAGLGFEIVRDLMHQTPEIADPFPMAHVAADAFRINDLFAPHQDLGEIPWQSLLAREEINDEHALANVAASLGHQFQR